MWKVRDKLERRLVNDHTGIVPRTVCGANSLIISLTKLMIERKKKETIGVESEKGIQENRGNLSERQ